jgi:hypothetical protein
MLKTFGWGNRVNMRIIRESACWQQHIKCISYLFHSRGGGEDYSRIILLQNRNAFIRCNISTNWVLVTWIWPVFHHLHWTRVEWFTDIHYFVFVCTSFALVFIYCRHKPLSTSYENSSSAIVWKLLNELANTNVGWGEWCQKYYFLTKVDVVIH